MELYEVGSDKTRIDHHKSSAAHLKAAFLVTAKKVNDHNCLMSDSVIQVSRQYYLSDASKTKE